MTDAHVNLWGRRIGAVSWDAGRGVGVFEYDPAFQSAGMELSPFVMPIREAPYAFPALRNDAFTYAYNPNGDLTGHHQMSMAGKRSQFERDDLMGFAVAAGLKRVAAERIMDQVLGAVSDWPRYAGQANVAEAEIERIGGAHRVARLATAPRASAPARDGAQGNFTLALPG